MCEQVGMTCHVKSDRPPPPTPMHGALTCSFKSSTQLSGEEDISQFSVIVERKAGIAFLCIQVVKCNAAHRIHNGANIDYPTRGRLLQKICQKKLEKCSIALHHL